MTSAREFLLDLVAIPSVSAISNRTMIDYVRTRLSSEFWRFEEFGYQDECGVAKTNLLALTKNAVDNHAELALVCHSDTVPFEAGWQEAVHPVIRDNRIYGRGSCDVKGFLACALAAFEDLDYQSLHQPIAFVLTADEEVGCIGAKKLASARMFSSRYMIIGEPTSLHPVTAGKGYALGTILVRGKEAHSAFPTAGRSAIVDAALLITHLDLAAVALQRECNDIFTPPYTTLNIGLIEGGTAKNIVPGECRLVIEWRSIPGQRADIVLQLVQEQIRLVSEKFPGFDAQFDPTRIDPAFAPSDTHYLSDLLSSFSHRTATTIAFGSEAAHFSPLAEEVVVFGPGAMTVAHKTGEYVSISELELCVEYLKAAIARICCETDKGLG